MAMGASKGETEVFAAHNKKFRVAYPEASVRNEAKKAAAQQLARVLADVPEETDPNHAIQVCLSVKGGAEQLSAALADRKLPRDVAMRAIRTVQSSGRSEPTLIASLTQAGGLGLTSLVLQSGDGQSATGRGFGALAKPNQNQCAAEQ